MTRKRVSLGSLEEALSNPATFRAKLDADAEGGFGYTYASALRNGVYRYHSTNDRRDALDYVEQSILNSTKLKSMARRQETLEQLDWYIGEHTARNWPTFDHRVRISVPVPTRAIGSLSCTGEVGRIDLVPAGGYAGWLIVSEASPRWQAELRMPLVQGVLAERVLGVSVGDVQVGLIDFGQRQTLITQYTPDAVQRSFRRFARLVGQMGF